VSYWVDPSATAWEKGLVTWDVSAGQVLNAPATLAPNDALQDPNFCNPVQALKAHRLKRASKNFHTTHGCQKNPFCPKHT